MEPNEDRVSKIALTPEQWVGLLDPNGPWLPPCCGSVNAARRVLGEVLMAGCQMTAAQARTILAEIGLHDAVDGMPAVLVGQRGPLFWSADGSPWFAIGAACRELLGAGHIISESLAHNRRERMEQYAADRAAIPETAREIARELAHAMRGIRDERGAGERSPQPDVSSQEFDDVRRAVEAMIRQGRIRRA